MAKIYVSEARLHVDLGFWETSGSFSKNLSIPIEDIVSVEKTEKLDFNILGLRVGGSAIPFVFAYGHYRKNKKRIFSVWKKPQQVLILTLENQRFEKLVLGVTNADAISEQLGTRV